MKTPLEVAIDDYVMWTARLILRRQLAEVLARAMFACVDHVDHFVLRCGRVNETPFQ